MNVTKYTTNLVDIIRKQAKKLGFDNDFNAVPFFRFLDDIDSANLLMDDTETGDK